MEPIGHYLQEKGYIWKILQLPGHGTTPEDLKKKKWTDWTEYVLREVDASLKEYNNNVIMIGLSLGGALTLYILENRPDIKAGVCLATPDNFITWYQRILLKLPFIQFFLNKEKEKIDIFDPETKKIHKSYDHFYPDSIQELAKIITNVRTNLTKVNQPILIIQSKKDQIVNYKNANHIYNTISSTEKELLFVDKSSHVLTRDYDRDLVFAKCYEFIQQL